MPLVVKKGSNTRLRTESSIPIPLSRTDNLIHLPADSLFTTPDSSYKPTYYTGGRAICKGLWVARGVSTGYVCVHPNYNDDTTVSYPILVDSTLDAGYPIPFTFDRIFKAGTTIPLDSIGYFPNIGK